MPRPRSWSSAPRAGLLVAALLAPALATAIDPRLEFRELHLRRFGTEHGLVMQAVNTLAPSRTGHLWVGTQGGFARFDGARFEVFDTGNLPALPADAISWDGIVEDQAGALWVATSKGDVLRRRAGRQDFEVVRTATGGVARGLSVAGGAVWLATHSKFLVRFAGDTQVKLAAPEGLVGNPIRVIDGAGGRVWVATSRALLQFEGGRFVPGPPEVAAFINKRLVSSLAPARDGGAWLAGARWLARLDPEGRITGRWEWPATQDVLPLRLLEDRDGVLWIAGYEGLQRLRDGKLEGPFRAADGLPGDTVETLVEDGEGTVWIACSSSGIVGARAPGAVTLGRPEGLTSDNVLSVLERADGTFLVGTVAGVFTLRPGARPELLPGTGAMTVFSLLAARDGTIWIASWPGGLWRWRAGRLDLVYPNQVVAMLEAGDGSLWVSAAGGLRTVRDGKVTPVDKALAGPLVTAGRLDALLTGPDGATWALSESAGPHRLEGDRWVAPAGLGAAGGPPVGASFNALRPDPDGTLWLGTQGDGLWRLRGGAWTRFGRREGLPENTVAAILDDGAGHLWLAGYRGIHRVDRAAIEAVGSGRQAALGTVSYGLSDGLRSLESAAGTGNTALRARDGSLWFATAGGLTILDPRRERRDPTPHAMIVRAEADGAPMPLDGPGREIGPGVRRLELELAGVSLAAAERLRLRYRLEGFDAEWRDPGRDRRVQYTSLPPGAYRFAVQASLDGTTWVADGPPVGITVRAHAWQQPWFIPASALALLALAGAAAAWRERSLRARARELAAAAAAAAAEVRTLRGLLPVCAWCKKIRDDAGAWEQIEAYVSRHSHAEFSHAMCPECFAKHYPDDEEAEP